MFAEWQGHIYPVFSHNRTLQVGVVVTPLNCNGMVLLLNPTQYTCYTYLSFFYIYFSLSTDHLTSVYCAIQVLLVGWEMWKNRLVQVTPCRALYPGEKSSRLPVRVGTFLSKFMTSYFRRSFWLSLWQALFIFRKPNIQFSIWRPSLRLRYDVVYLTIRGEML